MEAEKAFCVVEVTVRWWVRPYVHALVLFCMTFGTQIDHQRLCNFIVKRGIKVVPVYE